MYRYILIIILLLIPSLVYADDFLPEGDMYFNKYYDTLAYTIGSIPDSSNCPLCIQYDTDLVDGEGSQGVLDGTDILDLATYHSSY